MGWETTPFLFMSIFQLHQVDYIHSIGGLQPIKESIIGLFASIRRAECEIESRENTRIAARAALSELNKHYNISATKSYYITQIEVKE